MTPQIRLTVLIAVFVISGLLLAVRLSGSGGADVEPDAPLNLARDGRVLEQVGQMDLDTARRKLSDENPAIRVTAIMPYARAVERLKRDKPAGERIATTQEVAPLVKMIREEKSEALRAAAITAMGQMRTYEEMDVLSEAMDDPSPTIRGRAMAAFGQIYGVSPACRATDSPAKRKAALKDLQKDALMRNAAAFYTSSRYKPGQKAGWRPRK
jgi:HEAT repeat protein